METVVQFPYLDINLLATQLLLLELHKESLFEKTKQYYKDYTPDGAKASGSLLHVTHSTQNNSITVGSRPEKDNLDLIASIGTPYLNLRKYSAYNGWSFHFTPDCATSLLTGGCEEGSGGGTEDGGGGGALAEDCETEDGNVEEVSCALPFSSTLTGRGEGTVPRNFCWNSLALPQSIIWIRSKYHTWFLLHGIHFRLNQR